MGNKLYVGNLPYSFRDEDLQQTFSQYGSVGSAKVMMERDTGRSKGFGFVEMGSDAEAQAAIQGVHGQTTAAVTWWSTKPVRWNPVLPVAVASVVAMAAAATVVVTAVAATATDKPSSAFPQGLLTA